MIRSNRPRGPPAAAASFTAGAPAAAPGGASAPVTQQINTMGGGAKPNAAQSFAPRPSHPPMMTNPMKPTPSPRMTAPNKAAQSFQQPASSARPQDAFSQNNFNKPMGGGAPSGFSRGPELNSLSYNANQTSVGPTPRNRHRPAEIIVKDKHGFASETTSLYGAFTMEDVTFRDPPPESMYQQVALQNNKLWIFTAKNKLLAKKELGEGNMTLRDTKQVLDDQVFLKRSRIKKMYVDDSGMHCILLSDTELFYNHWDSEYIFRIDVFSEDHFNDRQGSSVSQMTLKSIDIKVIEEPLFEIVAGTSEGHILHACYMAQPQQGDCSTIEKFDRVIEIEDQEPIEDIKIIKINEFVSIIAASSAKLYQFVGRDDGLRLILDQYKYNKNLRNSHSITIPGRKLHEEAKHEEGPDPRASGMLRDAIEQPRLQLIYQEQEDGRGYQVAGFGWMSDSLFFHAQFDIDQIDTSNKLIVRNPRPKDDKHYRNDRRPDEGPELQQVKYLMKERGMAPTEDEVPSSFAITMFHIIFMYPTNITVVSKHSGQVVYNNSFEKLRPLRGVLLDTRKHQLLGFSHKEKIMVASLQGEDQDAWKYFLKNGNVNDALKNCRTAKQQAQVSAYQANLYFKTGQYAKAAKMFIKSGLSFETVCLKYLQANQGIWLIEYLNLVLEKLKKISEAAAPPQKQPARAIQKDAPRPKDKWSAQRLVICTWITELRLSQIAERKGNIIGEDPSLRPIREKELEVFQQQFFQFLKDNNDDIDHLAVFNLLQTHGKVKECIEFAKTTGSHKELIIHYLNNHEYKKALDHMQLIKDKKVRSEQMKIYASILFKNEPKETLKALRADRFRDIALESLVPAMHEIPDWANKPARDFLTEYCIKIKRSTAKAVHNMAFNFYVHGENLEDLIERLKKEEANKQQGQPVFFEVDYAINVCQRKIEKLETEQNKHNRDHSEQINMIKKAQIILYGMMNAYSKAVKKALEINDTDMARDYANKPPTAKTCKKLWMKIAKHLFRSELPNTAGQQVKVQEALTIIRENNVLKVEDLLDLFPQKAEVSDMKEHLCNCLDDYEEKIKDLRGQIEKHSENTEKLRTQRRNMKNRHITINPAQNCNICFGTVFDDREFFVYPCGHAFHRECIRSYIQSYTAKDPRISKSISMIHTAYHNIDNIRMGGQLFDRDFEEGAGSFARKRGTMAGAQEEEKGLLSGFRDIFSSFQVKSGVQASLGREGAQKPQLTEEQKQTIRQKLDFIDGQLKKECLFCGAVLIDMIDNDIARASKDFEFGGNERSDGLRQYGGPNDLLIQDADWKIE